MRGRGIKGGGIRVRENLIQSNGILTSARTEGSLTLSHPPPLSSGERRKEAREE